MTEHTGYSARPIAEVQAFIMFGPGMVQAQLLRIIKVMMYGHVLYCIVSVQLYTLLAVHYIR